jgi:hypothetical protein
MKIDLQKYHQKIRDNETVSIILGLGAICFAVILWILATVLS